MTTSESTSQPESLDLDYDMWQGQFEFVGINNNNNNNNSTTSNATITTTNNNNNNNNINNKLYLNNNNISNSDKLSSHKLKNDSLEDLNFNIQTPPDFSKPILIDEETFLSLQPNDFDDIVTSGPNSTIFLDSNNTIYETTTPSPITTNNHNTTTGKILNNIENINLNNNLHHTHKYNCNKTNNNKIEILKNYKNKLICDSIQTNGIVNNNNTNTNKMMNGFTAEICDNFNEQLELLQRQVTDLADSQNTVDDRTTRTKTEYAVLQARYHMLEEQYREAELRAEERLAEEQKRHRELLARVEREAALQNENCQIKIRTIEIEANALRDETQRLRLLCDKQSKDLHETEEQLEIAKHTITLLQSEINEIRINEKKCQDDKQAAEDLMIELGKELERLRSEHGPALPTTSPETLRLEELHMELDELRQKNKSLEEQNEELQAAVLTRGVEEGRHLLNGTLNSLAQELEEMSQAQDSVDSATLASLSQLQQAYQDKEEENQRLKHYIDTILLNIVENYPQLLEVKATPTPMSIPATTATSATTIPSANNINTNSSCNKIDSTITSSRKISQ